MILNIVPESRAAAQAVPDGTGCCYKRRPAVHKTAETAGLWAADDAALEFDVFPG